MDLNQTPDELKDLENAIVIGIIFMLFASGALLIWGICKLIEAWI